ETVSGRPSIVSVTVPIRNRSYQGRTGALALDNAGRVPRFATLAMDATRARFSFERDRVSDHVEWAVAAAILAVAVLLGSLLVRELRFAPWSSDSPAQPAVSPVMPREAMSVPALMLA